MGWGKASQYGVRLNQRRSRNDHLGSRGEASLYFIGSGLVMFMPRAYGRDHAACIRKKSDRHA